MSKAIYQKLEYLDNGKAGNVIALDTYTGYLRYFSISCDFPEIPSGTKALFGGFAGKGAKLRVTSTSFSWYTYYSYGTTTAQVSRTIKTGLKYNLSYNSNSGWYLYEDGTCFSSKSGTSYSLGYFENCRLYMFGSNDNGTVGESVRARIYSANIQTEYDTNNIQLEPVKRLEDGICGFLDKKSGKFYSGLDEATAAEFTGPGLDVYYDENMLNVRPATLEQKLTFIDETKGLIKQAMINKGIEVTDADSFRSYAEKINAIELGSLTQEEYSRCLSLTNAIAPEPEYTALTLISNSLGAYIDTGINPYGKKLKYEFKFGSILGYVGKAMSLFGGFNATEAKNLGTMHGIRASYGNDIYWNLYAKTSNLVAQSITKGYSIGYTNDTVEGYYEISESSYSYRVVLNNPNNYKDNEVHEGSGAVSGEFPQTPTITLFSQNSENGIDANSPARTNTYYFRIYLDDIIVRDFIPAKDGSGAVCLYDKVSRTFFYAQNGTLGEGSI